MTMPQGDSGSDAVPAQILIKLGEMGAQLAVISQQLTTVTAAQSDHEQRLRTLERRQWPLPTLAALAAVIAAVVAVLAYMRKG